MTTRPLLWLAAGIVFGSLLGPTAAWAAERIELEWPSVFRIQAERTLPVQLERPVEVRLDRNYLPEIAVRAERLPDLVIDELPTLRIGNLPPNVAALYETGEACVFALAHASGTVQVLRLDRETGAVSEVTRF